MNDERFEREVRDALLRRALGDAPEALRASIRRIPADAVPSHRFIDRFGLRLVSALAAAAVIVVAAGFLVATRPPAQPGALPVTKAPLATGAPSVGSAQPSEPPGIGAVSGPWSGLRWSAPLGISDASFVTSMVSFDGALYAAGEAVSGTVVEAAVWRSADGSTWTRLGRAGPQFAGAEMVVLVVARDGLVAWGADGQRACQGQGAAATCSPAPLMLWTSPDGVTWTPIADASPFAGATISAITDGPAGLVAVGDTGWNAPAIWVSDTGATWTRLALGTAFADAHLSTVRAAGPGYVVGGGTGSQQVSVTGGPASTVPTTAAAWWSADGRTWTKASVEGPGGGGSNLAMIYVGSEGLVAVGATSDGRDSAAWTSPDGRIWVPIAASVSGTPSPAPGAASLPSYTLADDGTHILAVADTSQPLLSYWVSTNGTDWRELALSGATATDPANTVPQQTGRWLRQVFLVPDGLVATGWGSGDTTGTPVWHATAVAPSPSATVTPTPPAQTPSPADVAAAKQAVTNYTAVLVRGDYAAAYAMLGREAQTHFGSLASFTYDERAFFQSVAGRYAVTAQPSDAGPITNWLATTYGASIDLAHAVLVEVTYPGLAGNNAGYTLFIVNPTATGLRLYDVR